MQNNYEYIPNNSYNSKQIDQLNDNHDSHDLCWNGLLFGRQRLNKNSINWLCRVVNCPGSITLTKPDEKIRHQVEHELVRLHHQITDIELTSKQFTTKCKIRCETEPNLSARQIFLEEQAKVAKNSSASYSELAIALPSLHSIKPALEKRKKKGRPKLPDGLREIQLTQTYTHNSKNEKFLILNKSKNKILVFCSPTHLEALSKATHWYADGTFKSAAKYYYQLYIIHAYINNHMIPCCYALMNRRREKEYGAVLKALKSEAKLHNLKLDPKYIMTDFELAAINAFKANFEGIQSKGCLFHLCQSLMKKIGNCGLKSEYENNISFSVWFRSICCLALVPIDEVDNLFERIIETKPEVNGVDKFLDYFVDTYFEGPYPTVMWNHFETNNTPRTNNNLEGYNNKLNKHIGIIHPSIFKAIDKLKEEETDWALRYRRALTSQKAPPRNKLYVVNDAMLLSYKKMLTDKDILIDTYVKYVCAIFDYSKLSKKRKKLVNSSISDCASSSSGSGIDSD